MRHLIKITKGKIKACTESDKPTYYSKLELGKYVFSVLFTVEPRLCMRYDKIYHIFEVHIGFIGLIVAYMGVKD